MNELIGSWRLHAEIVTFSDNGERIEPHGANPDGRMMLSSDGRIMFLFGRAERQPPESDPDRVGLFNSMVAYTGKIRIAGPDHFITTVDLAMNPAIRGEQVRFFALEDNKLRIRTPEQTIPIYGERLLVVDLVWTREVDCASGP